MDLDRNINLSAGALWTGLREPVLALAEELALRRAATERPALTLRIRSAGIDVLRTSQGRRELLFSATGRPQLAVRDVADRLGGDLPKEAAVEFAEDQAVVQELTLPAQPDEVLKAIVRHKVESLAPWPLAQSLWGMRSAPVSGDSRHVRADVVVVSRVLLEDIAAALREAGAEVTALGVRLEDEEEVQIDFGGEDIRRKARRRAARLARIAAGVCVLLLALGLFAAWRSLSELSEIEEQTAALTATLRGAAAGQGETPMVAAANGLRQQRADALPAVAVLNDLSKLLPGSVYLTALTLSGGKLEMKGQGSGVPSLIQLLEDSPTFKDVNFAAATELDQQSKADAFSITAALEQAPQAGAAP